MPAQRARRSGKALLVRAAVLGLVASSPACGRACGGAGVTTSTAESRRAADALALLALLARHGATHLPLEVGPSVYGGLGVKVAAPVAAGATILTMPSSITFKGSGHATLPLAILRERLRPTSEWTKVWLRTLPAECASVPGGAVGGGCGSGELHAVP